MMRLLVQQTKERGRRCRPVLNALGSTLRHPAIRPGVVPIIMISALTAAPPFHVRVRVDRAPFDSVHS
jgi:hypothetical protein